MGNELFISHAKNLEDVLLWRALKHVQQGSYIDIGAHDPDVDSVSKAFHAAKWHGLHVEPVPSAAAKLRTHRPGDTVIEAIVTLPHENAEIFVFPDSSLTTTNEKMAQFHLGQGQKAERVPVGAVALEELMSVALQPVHWLKIDAQGDEGVVLESWGASPVRPWVLVIKSNYPLLTSGREQWEPALARRGYKHALFDGISHFYFHESHPELQSSFQSGPNALDGFTLSGTATNLFTANITRQSEGLLQSLQKRVELAESRLKRVEAANTLLERQYADICSSTSWRVTVPLRLGVKAMRQPVRAARSLARRATRIPGLIKRVGAGLARRLARHQGLKRVVRRMVDAYPPLGRWTRKLIQHVPAGMVTAAVPRRRHAAKGATGPHPGMWAVDLSGGTEQQLKSIERLLLDLSGPPPKGKAQ
jgi:FkbM family methyltransferase